MLGGDFRLPFLLPGVAVLSSLHQVFKKQRSLYCEIKSTNFRERYNRKLFSILKLEAWMLRDALVHCITLTRTLNNPLRWQDLSPASQL